MLVTNFDAPTGGVQKNSRLLLKELGKRGVGTFACARNYYGLPADELVDETQIHRSPVWGSSLAVNGILYLIDTFLWLVKNRKRYDVVHCQQMFGPAMAAAVASFLVRKPIIVRVTTVGDLGEVKHIRQMPLSRIRIQLIRRVSKWVALTQEMANELTTLNIPRDRIKIIYNSTEIPIDTAFDNEAKTSLIKEIRLTDEKIGVFLGRLSEEKNLDVLIEAWKSVMEKYPDARLLLIGAGGDFRNVETALRKQVENLGLSNNVHFLGHVANAKDYVLASDVFVLPSRSEGMSNALVEALACGAAIVATDIPANSEICEDGINSLLIPVGDSVALSRAIIRLFDTPELARRLAAQARAKAEQELTVDKMVCAYLDVYREAIATV